LDNGRSKSKEASTMNKIMLKNEANCVSILKKENKHQHENGSLKIYIPEEGR